MKYAILITAFLCGMSAQAGSRSSEYEVFCGHGGLGNDSIAVHFRMETDPKVLGAYYSAETDGETEYRDPVSIKFASVSNASLSLKGSFRSLRGLVETIALEVEGEVLTANLRGTLRLGERELPVEQGHCGVRVVR